MVIGACGAALALVLGAVAVWGSVVGMTIGTYTTTTTATADQIWPLWADVSNRTRWDAGLEDIELDGKFVEGATGTVQLTGQPERNFTLIEVDEPRRFTDRFHLPLATNMDWQHSVVETTPSTRTVTFRISIKGPTALPVGLISRTILDEEMPRALAALTELAEGGPREAP